MSSSHRASAATRPERVTDLAMLKRLMGIAAAVALIALGLRRVLSRKTGQAPLQQPDQSPIDRQPTPVKDLSEPDSDPPDPKEATENRATSPSHRISDVSPEPDAQPPTPDEDPTDIGASEEPKRREPDSQSPVPVEKPPIEVQSPQPSTTPEISGEPKPSATQPTTDQSLRPPGSAEKTRPKRRPRAPIDKGGRPRTPNQPKPTERKSRTPHSTGTGPRAHLCVWQQGMAWQLGVQIESEPKRDLRVQQDGHELERDDFDLDRWLVRDGQGYIEILDGQECVRRIDNLARPGHLVFRLRGTNLDRGVLTKHPSAGSFLLLIPSDWDPLESDHRDLIGEYEEVTPSTFHAYYIDIDPSSSPTLWTGPDGASSTPVRFNEVEGRFRLKGRVIEDIAPKQGPLYGPSPPEIVDARNWAGISVIVVGEEGGGKGRWRHEIKPDLPEPSKRLAEFMSMRRAGWFFLRFYDQQSDLVDSLDFRYAAGIKGPPQQIESGESSPERKFDIVHIEHESNVRIEASDPDNGNINSELVTPGDSNLRIPHMKTYDRTEWTVVDGNTKVPLHIELPRFWRRLRSESNGTCSRWSPKAITLQEDDFKPTLRQVLDVSVPSDSSKTVLIDFDFPSKRRFRATVNCELQVPLWNFFDSNHLISAGRHVLSLLPEIPSSIDTTPPIKLGILELQTRCAYCSRAFAGNVDLLDHIVASHIDEVFVEETYEKTARQFPNLGLPDAIYICEMCQEFYLSGHSYVNGRYLQTIQNCTINKHNNEIHKHAHNAFEPVSDAGSVRDQLIKSLPYLYRCKICARSIKVDKEEKIGIKLSKHLMRFHLSDVSRAI